VRELARRMGRANSSERINRAMRELRCELAARGMLSAPGSCARRARLVKTQTRPPNRSHRQRLEILAQHEDEMVRPMACAYFSLASRCAGSGARRYRQARGFAVARAAIPQGLMADPAENADAR